MITTNQGNPRLLIAYELIDPAHTDLSRKVINDALESLGAERRQSFVWILRTELSIAAVLEKLDIHFNPTDHLFIAQIGDSVNMTRDWRPAISDLA